MPDWPHPEVILRTVQALIDVHLPFTFGGQDLTVVLRDVVVPAVPLDRFEPVIGRARADVLVAVARDLGDSLAGRTVWNVNSTASGGGVAEMLPVLVGYALGSGIAARWVVIEGDEQFFVITKRVHHWLHGADGDGHGLGPDEISHYERVLANNSRMLRQRVRPGDIVILHDPQTAGLIPSLKLWGVVVVWRCHVGAAGTNDRTNQGWSFLRRYVQFADAFVFSRAEYAGLDALGKGTDHSPVDRPVLAKEPSARRCKRIPDQIASGTGVLLADPFDLETAGQEMMRLLTDDRKRPTLGAAAHDHVRANFIGDLHLVRYAELLGDLVR